MGRIQQSLDFKGEEVDMKDIILILFCLTLTVIVSIHHTDAEIDPNSIVGIWLLDEGKGDKISDSSGNENDGTIIGAEWTDGKIGNALAFDGTSRVEIPTSESIDDYLDGFTYLLWVKPTAIPGGSHIRLIERDWHNPTIMIGTQDFYGSIVVDGKQDFSHVRGGKWKQDEWSFVAITHHQLNLKLYVDGELVGDESVGKADEKPNGVIRFAAYSRPGWDFTGVIDEVGVFNVPLSENDLNNIMKNGLEGAADVTPVRKLTTTWGDMKSIW